MFIRNLFTKHLSPESVQVLRIVEDCGQPVLLGTDMHVLMGEAEIAEFAYDPASMVCRFTATRPRGRSGMAVVHAPPHLRVDNFDGLHIAKDGRDDSLIIGVPLNFADGDCISCRLQFAPLDAPRKMSVQDLA